MTEDQIEHMVSRFLGWRLPETFNPDGGVSFKATYNEGTPYEGRHQPSGTNLLNAEQAEAMVRYMVEGLGDDHKCFGGVTPDGVRYRVQGDPNMSPETRSALDQLATAFLAAQESGEVAKGGEHGT